MTPPSNLDHQGSFQTHPFAEVVTEINQARLSGSLRISEGEKKAIAYFSEGSIVYAVSNQRKHQLAAAGAGTSAAGPAHSNDLEFVDGLRKKGVLSEEQIEKLQADQLRDIVRDLLEWKTGDWKFSPLTKVKESIRVRIAQYGLLVEFARGLSDEELSARFKSQDETFQRRSEGDPPVDLTPHDAFVLSRLDTPLTIAALISTSGLPSGRVHRSLYTLWVAGLVERSDWSPAFSDIKLEQIRNANLVIRSHAVNAKPAATPKPAAKAPEPEPTPMSDISLEDYLAQVEKATSHYEVLGVSSDAQTPVIRGAYFTLAKMFHPDRFHRQDAAILRRVETAFTQLAQAHETLRNSDTRRAYDSKLKQARAEDEMRRGSALAGETGGNLNADRAEQEFEHGRKLLMDDDYEAALPFLARAVHFAPLVARYHAFFGKALSQDESHRHKAENAMQQAIRLDPNNAAFRMMLAEFFVKMKLTKRAEGELTRLINMAPDHAEANALLDSLRQK